MRERDDGTSERARIAALWTERQRACRRMGEWRSPDRAMGVRRLR
jgi:hypothetical protein